MSNSNTPTLGSMTQVNIEKVATTFNSETSTVKFVKTSDKDVEKATTKSTTGNTIDLEDEIYNRFSKGRKRAIVAIVSFAALLAPFASSSFLPSIPQMSRDLKVSQSVINYTVAIFLATIGIAPLAWSPYSTYYGRQKIYLVSLPIFVAGSIGVALSHNLVELIITRIIQGAGASSVLAVGAGSIGDIYKPTERGRAMGLFYAGAVLGPALSPVIAGIVTQYIPGKEGSWRANQFILAGMGTVCFLLMLFVLPETSHTRGIDKARKALGPHAKDKFIWVWINPLKPLDLLKQKSVLAISLTSSFVLLANYSLLVPLTFTLGPRFGVTNEALLGTFYLAPGAGNIVGSRLSGLISDATLKRWIAKREHYVPEDRLRATFIFGGIVVPTSIIGLGFTIQFWTASGGLALSLVLLFISGVGFLGVFAVCNTYLVDAVQTRSAEAIATNNCLRYIASAGASAVVLPLIQKIGIAATNGIAAAFTVLGFSLIVWTVICGEKWRDAESRVHFDGDKSASGPDSKK